MEPAEVVRQIKEIDYTAEKKRKKRKKPKLKVIEKSSARKQQTRRLLCVLVPILVVAIVGAVSGFVLWYQSFEEINLAKQTSLVVSGYDGRGIAELSVESIPGYQEFFAGLQSQMSKATELRNGDEIQITYAYDKKLAKKLKIRVEGEETELTIEGLATPTEVSEEDLFAALQFNMEDLSPVVKVSLENSSEDAFLQTIPFTIAEPKGCYQTGEQVTVRATVDQEAAFTYAYHFEGDKPYYEKTFEIPAGDAYLTDVQELTEEHLSTLMTDGVKYFDAKHAKEYGLRIFSEAHLMPQWNQKSTAFSWVNPYVISAYFNVVSDQGKELLQTHVNDVKVVYEATLAQPDGQACQAEVVVQYTDLIKRADGSLDLQLDSGKVIAASYRNANIKGLVRDTDDGNYISTKLK